MNFIISSTAFGHNENIPQKFTCDGEEISPDLEWKNYPLNTQSFVLIIDDPDAPHGTWDHFIAFNIPRNINKIEENALNTLQKPAKIIKNSWGQHRYGGPCPPINGPHRYFFKIYALDTMLDLSTNVSKTELIKNMAHHILTEATLIGIYKRISSR